MARSQTLSSGRSVHWAGFILKGTLGGMAALVVGCVAVPDRNPVPLALEVPAAWSSEAYALTSAATKLSQWWMRFDDSAMNALVLAAQDAHTSVIAARAAVQQAIALREGAQANLSPKLNLSASAQRSRSGDGSPANNVQTGLNGDWAPDVLAQNSALSMPARPMCKPRRPGWGVPKAVSPRPWP